MPASANTPHRTRSPSPCGHATRGSPPHSPPRRRPWSRWRHARSARRRGRSSAAPKGSSRLRPRGRAKTRPACRRRHPMRLPPVSVGMFPRIAVVRSERSVLRHPYSSPRRAAKERICNSRAGLSLDRGSAPVTAREEANLKEPLEKSESSDLPPPERGEGRGGGRGRQEPRVSGPPPQPSPFQGSAPPSLLTGGA